MIATIIFFVVVAVALVFVAFWFGLDGDDAAAAGCFSGSVSFWVAALLMGAVSSCSALTLGVQVAATHLGPMNYGAARHVFTPGAYVVLDNGLTLGAYRNTLERTSAQVGYTYDWADRWSVSAGLVTGYPGTRTGYATEPSSRYPLPFVAVSYRFGGGPLGARVMWMPQRTQPIGLAGDWRP